MKQVLCSTGAFIGKSNNRNHRLLDECAKKVDCDGFELMLYPAWYEILDTVVPDIKKMSLNIPVLHSDKNIGEKISSDEEGTLDEALSRFEINCQVASDLEVRNMVLHLWGGIPSDKNIEKNIAVFAKLNAMAQKYGITLLVENVVCNRKDPMTHFLELYHAYPDISFTFDTKMAAFHGQMDMACEKEWRWMWGGGHIKHLHINDYNGGYMDWKNFNTLHIGEGKIGFDKFFSFLHDIGYSGDYTIEAVSFKQSGEIEFERMNNTVKTLRSKLYG